MFWLVGRTRAAESPGHGEPPRFPRTEHRDALLPIPLSPPSPSVHPSIRPSFPPANLEPGSTSAAWHSLGVGDLVPPCLAARRPVRSPFAPTAPGTVVAVSWAGLSTHGWDGSVGMAGSLSAGLLEITPEGRPFSPSSWFPTGMGHPRTGLSCAWCPAGPRDPRVLLCPASPSLRRAEQCGGAGGCICPVPVPVPIPGPSPSILTPPQCPFWWQKGGGPNPCPPPCHASSPMQDHQPPPRQGRWVPASSRNPGPNPAWGPWAGRQDWRQLGGPSSRPPCSRGGQGRAGGRPAGGPSPWGSVGAKHLRDGSARSATQSPFPPRSPPHPRFRDVPGKGPPGPHPSQRRAVTVTRGSLFIVTNCRN